MTLKILAGVYYQDELVTIEHQENCAIPGYFILFLKPKCNALTELDDASYLHFSRLLKKTYQVTETVVAPEKIYVCAFAEVNPQLHFHVFPRSKELTARYREAYQLAVDEAIDGAQYFKWAREHSKHILSVEEEQSLHEKFRQQFALFAKA